ncbi:Rrf2 family transcriptional regulator [Paenibacillus sp. JTLBN-2024]
MGNEPGFSEADSWSACRGGLVLVQHGGTGAGWKLARRPEEISLLKDVYEAAVQTPLFELHHSQPNPSCIIGNGIQPALQEIYEDSEEALKRRLAQETIKDLVGSSLEHGER